MFTLSNNIATYVIQLPEDNENASVDFEFNDNGKFFDECIELLKRGYRLCVKIESPSGVK